MFLDDETDKEMERDRQFMLDQYAESDTKSVVEIWCNSGFDDERSGHVGQNDRDGDRMTVVSNVGLGDLGFAPVQIIIEQGVSPEFVARSLRKAADLVERFGRKFLNWRFSEDLMAETLADGSLVVEGYHQGGTETWRA